MPAEWKQRFVKQIADEARTYSVIAVVDFANMPLAQLQNLRASLRGTVVIHGGRKRLFEHVLSKSGSGTNGNDFGKLKEHLNCEQPGILFSNETAFALAKKLKKSRTPAPIKGGQKAPKDIIVPAGPTGFAPGPIIGELGDAGVKAGIDAGKVVVKQDSLVAKQGDVVSQKLAAVLSRLGVQPMEIGLNLIAAYEGGFVFPGSVLDVDEAKFIANIEQASIWAFNLAMNAHVTTKETLPLLIQQAHRESRALALSQNIMADAVVADLVAKANAEMSTLKKSSGL